MAVCAITDAVKNYPDRWTCLALFSKTTGQVRMMMLHGNCFQATLFQCITCGVVIRVLIVGNQLWSNLQNLL